MTKDPYQVLGVSPSASDDDIAKAYRKLAKTYHPDVNHGSPEAAAKMSEINAAYERIKSGAAAQGSGPYQGQAGYGAQGSYGQAGYGQGGASSSDPFGFGFDPFEFFSGGFAGGRQGASPLGQARSFINAGLFAKADDLLKSMDDRGAEWHCLRAVAQSGMGNAIDALRHAKTAVQMEPDNPEYRGVLNQLQNGGQAYRQRSQGYGMPTVNLGNLCLGVILTNLFCTFCRPF